MDYVDLTDNNLSGSIPTEIGLLDQIRFLYLNVNASLRGTIPTEIGLLSNNLLSIFLNVSCFIDYDFKINHFESI